MVTKQRDSISMTVTLNTMDRLKSWKYSREMAEGDGKPKVFIGMAMDTWFQVRSLLMF